MTVCVWLQVSVVLAGFSRHRLADALEFVKQNADYSPQSSESDENGRQRQLHITGVFYSRSFASAVETELKLRYDDHINMRPRFCNFSPSVSLFFRPKIIFIPHVLYLSAFFFLNVSER